MNKGMHTFGVFGEPSLRYERPPIYSGFSGNELNKEPLAVGRIFPTVIH